MLATSTNNSTIKLTESSTTSTNTDTLPIVEYLKKRSKKDYNNNKKRSTPYTVNASITNSENSKKNFTKK